MPKRANDICIVGFGCVLPDAPDTESFWDRLVHGRCCIRELPESRLNQALYVSESDQFEDKSCPGRAGFVDQAIIKAIEAELGHPRLNRLQAMTLSATQQALQGVKSGLKALAGACIYLGCMDQDQTVGLQRFLPDLGGSIEQFLEENLPQIKGEVMARIADHFRPWETEWETRQRNYFTSSIFGQMRRRFGLAGEAALIDAACASSLAALDVASRALRQGKADLAVSGGIESNLSAASQVMFTRLKALARQRCLPFDQASEGLIQGEGAVIFILQRREDALACGNIIQAVISRIGASCDGRSGSLFSPTVDGQVRAYQRAYGEAAPDALTYLEAHGTGTAVGDQTEVRSIRQFFGPRPFPVGSSKALLGHTKGAAGAAGLLKCLLSIRHRTIPPSAYLEHPLENISDVPGQGAWMNRTPIPIKEEDQDLIFGVSAFGFGGINYHLVLTSHSGSIPDSDSSVARDRPIVLVAAGSQPLLGIRETFSAERFSIPPGSLSSIDEVQLAALLCVAETIKKHGLMIPLLDKRQVHVISAGGPGLDNCLRLEHRVNHFELVKALAGFDQRIVDQVMEHKTRLPEITEDTGPGLLSNVISGRVANSFNLTGTAFHVDADFASTPAALAIAGQLLTERSGMVILISLIEELDEKKTGLIRTGVECRILASIEFAEANNLPIQAILDLDTYDWI